jgi:TonB-linked SusC/RagA family outer membrane protein
MHFILYGREVRSVPFLLLPRKIVLFMRLTALLLVIGCMHVSANGLSQRVTISAHKASLPEVLRDLASQAGVNMIFNADQLKTAAPVTIELQGIPWEDALKAVLKSQALDYILKDGAVIIRKQEREAPERDIVAAIPPADAVDVTVKVVDEEGKPLIGATVQVKGTNRVFIANTYGIVQLKAVPVNSLLLVSSLGFAPETVKLQTSGVLMVRLKTKVNELSSLEINTGIFRRSKESFTGAATVFTGAELKAVGNRNILQSLKSLDPAFVEVENNLQGSNPNRLPSYEIRGRTSINTANLNDQFSSDPNQPLFILDGFESTLQAIYDLDINRVAAVTILKDAASTALYGAKAANGVVVVETKRPVPGELRASYAGDFGLDVPDLSSYNLMNGAEKLQFEKLAGIYDPVGVTSIENVAKYNYRLSEVQRGVNTYWLGEPVRAAFSNRHSLQVSGGNQDLMMNGGVRLGNQPGVLKGSSRQTWGANMGVTYRKKKINIQNLLSLSGTTAKESPYGSFSVFANANPYYRKYNDDGSIRKQLDPVYDAKLLNPLYDAMLNKKDETRSFDFTNNFQAIYTLSPQWRFQAGFMVGKGNTTSLDFVPPNHSSFATVADNLKGKYSNSRQENSTYSSNITITYAKVMGKSQLTAIARGDLQQQTSEVVGFSAVGFPEGTDGSPAFATGFAPYSTPIARVNKARSIGTLASVNYVFDRRFMVDAVYRLDGASVFGSSELFKPFVSAGVGWNIHREHFMEKYNWISLLKLRGNMGFTGNENLGQFSSVSLYNFSAGISNAFGPGLTMTGLGNPSLDWQKTFQESYGMDFAFLDNRISGSLEYFRKKTDPLAVGASGTLASSAGVNQNYVINLGHLTTRGWNLNLRVSPIYNLKERIIWTIGVMGSNHTSVYGGFADRLAELNKKEQTNKTLNRYNDGFSPDDMWAVVSRGVDPATGLEVFQKKSGRLTFDYDPADIVRVGNTRPKIEGTVNTSFTYKAFTLGAVIRYKLNGYVFNSALYQKVENTGQYSLAIKSNLDKRALYERWQKPGDIAMYTGINGVSSTPMSSRFIQKDSHFTGESINVSWRSSAGWVRTVGLQSLSFNFYLNDIFRLESIMSERGIDYPYARSLSFSVNASF